MCYFCKEKKKDIIFLMVSSLVLFCQIFLTPITSISTRAVSLGIRFIAFHNEQSARYATSGYTGRGDFQELDQIEATKLSIKATGIHKLLGEVFDVLDCAVNGHPGGCYLKLISHLLSSKIEKVAELLRRAERALVVFGKGVAYARAEDELRKLVETTGIPFLPTPMGKGILPDTNDLAATDARSLSIGKCDVALVVGARLNWLLHFGEPPKWSSNVKFILVDVNEEEIELRMPSVGLVGDAKKIVCMLNKKIKDTPFCFARNHPWVDSIATKAKDYVLKMEA
ncbi:lyase [Lithospermum erythrorhizon]|uniref:Lyase n=1 Tax=Lithospermum erythrorhizon TaxID=34254 RepID=A0AAV3PQ25_LITER